jgi:hypothetical protein
MTLLIAILIIMVCSKDVLRTEQIGLVFDSLEKAVVMASDQPSTLPSLEYYLSTLTGRGRFKDKHDAAASAHLSTLINITDLGKLKGKAESDTSTDDGKTDLSTPTSTTSTEVDPNPDCLDIDEADNYGWRRGGGRTLSPYNARHITDLKVAAEALCNLAILKGSFDDMTAVVVELRLMRDQTHVESSSSVKEFETRSLSTDQKDAYMRMGSYKELRRNTYRRQWEWVEGHDRVVFKIPPRDTTAAARNLTILQAVRARMEELKSEKSERTVERVEVITETVSGIGVLEDDDIEDEDEEMSGWYIPTVDEDEDEEDESSSSSSGEDEEEAGPQEGYEDTDDGMDAEVKSTNSPESKKTSSSSLKKDNTTKHELRNMKSKSLPLLSEDDGSEDRNMDVEMTVDKQNESNRLNIDSSNMNIDHEEPPSNAQIKFSGDGTLPASAGNNSHQPTLFNFSFGWAIGSSTYSDRNTPTSSTDSPRASVIAPRTAAADASDATEISADTTPANSEPSITMSLPPPPTSASVSWSFGTFKRSVSDLLSLEDLSSNSLRQKNGNSSGGPETDGIVNNVADGNGGMTETSSGESPTKLVKQGSGDTSCEKRREV